MKVICDDQSPFNQNIYFKLIESGGSMDFQLKFIHKSGETIEALVKIKIIHEEVFNKHFLFVI